MFTIVYSFTPNKRLIVISIFFNDVFIGGQSMNINPEHYPILIFYLENFGILISNIINIKTKVKDIE
jgi:hypothetical protein